MSNRPGVGRHTIRVGVAVLALVVLAVVTVTVTRTPPERESEPSNALDEAEVAPEAPVPSPTPVGAEPTEPSPTAPVAGGASYVVPWSDAPTEEPGEPPAPEDRAAPPRATRGPQPCVEYTWDAADSTAVFGQLIVEIRVRNECGRVLESLDVMFRADAMRGGDVIYSGQGNVLERLYPGSVRTVMIALPGSADSFDRVAVTPINPPVR